MTQEREREWECTGPGERPVRAWQSAGSGGWAGRQAGKRQAGRQAAAQHLHCRRAVDTRVLGNLWVLLNVNLHKVHLRGGSVNAQPRALARCAPERMTCDGIALLSHSWRRRRQRGCRAGHWCTRQGGEQLPGRAPVGRLYQREWQLRRAVRALSAQRLASPPQTPAVVAPGLRTGRSPHLASILVHHLAQDRLEGAARAAGGRCGAGDAGQEGSGGWLKAEEAGLGWAAPSSSRAQQMAHGRSFRLALGRPRPARRAPVYSTAMRRSLSWYSLRSAYCPLCLSAAMSKLSSVSESVAEPALLLCA